MLQLLEHFQERGAGSERPPRPRTSKAKPRRGTRSPNPRSARATRDRQAAHHSRRASYASCVDEGRLSERRYATVPAIARISFANVKRNLFTVSKQQSRSTEKRKCCNC